MLPKLIKNYFLGIPATLAFVAVYLCVVVIFYGGLEQHPNILLVLRFGLIIGVSFLPLIVFIARHFSWLTKHNYPLVGIIVILLFVISVTGSLYAINETYRENIMELFGENRWAFPLSIIINFVICVLPGFTYLFILFSLDSVYDRVVASLFRKDR